MKKIIFCAISVLMFLMANAQQNATEKFKSIALEETLSKWVSIHRSCENVKEKEYNDVWANKIKDNFQFMNESKIEISFVFTSDNSYDINSLMDASLDYLCDKFKVVDHNKGSEINRTNLKDPEAKTIYFNGVINKTSSWNGGAAHYIHTDIIFKMKFKENKIKVTVTIPNYNYRYFNTTAAVLVGVGNYQDNILAIPDYPPFKYENCPGNPGSNRNLRYIDFYAVAYINSCSYILNYVEQYKKYLNTHDLDW